MNPEVRALYHFIADWIDQQHVSNTVALEVLELVASEFEDRIAEDELSWSPGVPTDTVGYEEMICEA